jgi:hypothetical protein
MMVWVRKGNNRRTWNLLIVSFLMWNLFAIPFRFGFEHFWTEPGAGAMFLIIDYLGDLLFWFVNFCAYYRPLISARQFK